MHAEVEFLCLFLGETYKLMLIIASRQHSWEQARHLLMLFVICASCARMKDTRLVKDRMKDTRLVQHQANVMKIVKTHQSCFDRSIAQK